MYRIYIDWTFTSPALKTIIGTVTVHYVTKVTKWRELAKFQIKKEPNVTSFKVVDEKPIPSKLYEAIKPELYALINGYYNGLTLDNNSYHWVLPDENQKALTSQKELPSTLNTMDKGIHIEELIERKGD